VKFNFYRFMIFWIHRRSLKQLGKIPVVQFLFLISQRK